jgi:hypothetical protein
MKIIKARIRGKGKGILLHNPAGMGATSSGKKAIPSPEVEAEAGCYWVEDRSSLGFPSWNLFRCYVKAGAAFKAGKVSGSKIIASGITIEPEMLSFNTKKYDIDSQRAVVMRSGIIRSRPLLRNWELEFDALVNEEDVDPKFIPVLRAIMEEAGRRVGLGDFRVERNGPYGKFEVVSWEVQ